MIYNSPQNWRTSLMPWSLSLARTVNTGVTFDTSSGAVANSKWFATRGFQGYGPMVQYPGAGMDGVGCGCGCKSAGMCGLTFDGSGLLGTGLFSSDTTTWTVGAEGVAAIVGLVMLYSTFASGRRGAKRARGAISGARKGYREALI